MKAPSTRASARPLYVGLGMLSKGGMGRVELVVRREGPFARLYAMKRLLPQLLEEPTLRQMFLEEARLAGLVRHVNIVSVLDFGEDEEGPYLIMEYVEGVSAARLIRSALDDGVRLPVQACLRIAGEMARGLQAAHEAIGHDGQPLGIVHRDVSPQNVLIGFDGVTRVTDFGIAKALDSASKTTTGILKGKMGYIAPERLRFEAADHRADLFSAGVILYELLSGARLYSGHDQVTVARSILDDAPPDIGIVREDVPADIVELLFELLAKSAEDRPATAREVAERIEQALTTLAFEDGPFDLSAYLSTRHAAVRDARRKLVAEALAHYDAIDSSAGEPRRPRDAARIAVLGTVIAVGAVAALALAWSQRAPSGPPAMRVERAPRIDSTAALAIVPPAPALSDASAAETEPPSEAATQASLSKSHDSDAEQAGSPVRRRARHGARARAAAPRPHGTRTPPAEPRDQTGMWRRY